MATENQLAALRNWLKQEMPKGEAVCEMPGEVCSDALSRLHEASEKFKEDKKTNYGLVLKTKKEIVSELREQGWIGVPISEGEEKEKKVEKASELPKKPDEKEVFGDRAEAEAQKIRDEQGLAPAAPEQKPPLNEAGIEPPQQPKVTELIEKYGDIRAQVTEYVRTNERIPEREKGYAINWISDQVIKAMQTGGDQE